MCLYKQTMSDNDAPLYGTDDFRIYCFKVLPCSKHFSHDWVSCPFAHPGERARRRCVRTNNYRPRACPDVQKHGQCPRGDACSFTHNVFEFHLHPQRYRTQWCHDGSKCTRKICFFAHSLEELRVPEMEAAAAMQQQTQAQAAGGSSPACSMSVSSNSSSLALCPITLADASKPAMPGQAACYIKAACNSGHVGSPNGESSPMLAAMRAAGLQARGNTGSSCSFGSSISSGCCWESASLAGSATGAHVLQAHPAAQLGWEASSALLRANSQSSMHMQPPQQLLQLAKQQQQYGMLLGCSTDAAAPALQWLELQADQPAAAAAGYPCVNGCIADSARLSLLLEATSSQLHAQLSLDSNAVIYVPAATCDDVLQVGSYGSSMDLSSMLASQTLLAGPAVLQRASSGLQTLPQPQPQMLCRASMPEAYSAASAGMYSGPVPGVAGMASSMSNQLLVGAGGVGVGVAGVGGVASDVHVLPAPQGSCSGMHPY